VFVAYVELHAHSAFSFLDGSSTPAELVGAAEELGYTAFALTDHNGVFGSMEFAQAAAAAGVRAIHGCELDVVDDDDPDGERPERHLTLLVRDATGWRNLCRLLTLAHAHTRTPQGGPVIDTPRVTLGALCEHAEGLVCLSGCSARGARDEPTARRLLAAFGRDALRIELQRPFQRHDRALNRGLASLAERLGVPCVATGNVHAHSRERALVQDVFVAIREHTTLDASEPVRRGNHAHVLASPAAMAARFADHPDAVAETGRLAETLTFDLTHDLGYRYPGAEDDGADRDLARICHARFDSRYALDDPHRVEAAARLEEELSLIAGLGLSGFFNLHHELLELARDVACEVRGPGAPARCCRPGAGRGSSVSSIVCYLTASRTSTRSRTSCSSGASSTRRSRRCPTSTSTSRATCARCLIPRIHDKYGRDRAALVAAFPTYRARGAIREFGKALGAARGRDRARGARLGGVGERGGEGHRRRAGGGPRLPRAGAGRGSRGWPPRRTSCPATCPSTRAG
jgi:error-prone DNA polymerase